MLFDSYGVQTRFETKRFVGEVPPYRTSCRKAIGSFVSKSAGLNFKGKWVSVRYGLIGLQCPSFAALQTGVKKYRMRLCQQNPEPKSPGGDEREEEKKLIKQANKKGTEILNIHSRLTPSHLIPSHSQYMNTTITFYV